MKHPAIGLFALAVAGAANIGVTDARANPSPTVAVVSPLGTEAWLRSDPAVPIVSISFRFSGGAAFDAPGKEGLTRFLVSLLDEGAGPLDSQAFRERLDDRAIRLGFSASRDDISGFLMTLREHLDEAAELLGLALSQPRFDEGPVERIRELLESSREQGLLKPGTLAGARWTEQVYGEGPYGRPFRGTRESLASINRDDLQSAARERLVRSRLVVGVAGDVDEEVLARVLDVAFGDLDFGTPPEGSPETGRFDGTVLHVPMDVPQTELVFGLPALSRHDEQFFPAFVMNAILGGSAPGARLNREVRELRGLTYGIHTSIGDYDRGARLVGSTSTRDDTAAETVQVITDVFRDLSENGVSQDELEDAKRYLTGAFPLSLDSTSKLARFLVTMQSRDLGMDYLERRNERVEAVTEDDVASVARRLLEPDRLTWVAVGRSDPFTDANVPRPEEHRAADGVP